MLNKKLKKVGKITTTEDQIFCDGFEADDCMCREVGALAMLWAIGELQKELQEVIARPGGTGKCGVD